MHRQRHMVGLLAALVLLSGCHAGTPPRTRTAVPRARAAPQGRRTKASATATALDTAAENARPGTPGWRIPARQVTEQIAGYADQASVLPGQPVRLFVSTSSPTYTVTAFRIGWYGGARARAVWRSGSLRGEHQRAPRVSAAPLRTVTDPWHPSLTVPTRGWPEGDYLLRLGAGPAGAHFVPLVLRSRSTAGRVVILNAVTTWQAYNAWGGYSLYQGPGGRTDFAHRSRAVSFDRPYDKNGADVFLGFEQGVVSFAERRHARLAYVTSTDVAEHRELLDGARGVLSLGHDEYWTPEMKRSLAAARDRGTNIAFLGANAVYRRIRLQPSTLGLGPVRVVVCYKLAREDPLYGRDDAHVTANFPDQPRPQPQNRLIGMLYECFGANDAYVIERPGFWLFAGTGVRRGSRFPGMVGPEYDRAYPRPGTPRPLEVVAHSPVLCRGVPSFADSTYYTARSGAAVFATGTNRWNCALAGGCRRHGVTDAATRFTQRVTATLLTAFARGPAGWGRPAVDNFAALRESPRNPTGAA